MSKSFGWWLVMVAKMPACRLSSAMVALVSSKISLEKIQFRAILLTGLFGRGLDEVFIDLTGDVIQPCPVIRDGSEDHGVPVPRECGLS